MTSHLTIRMAWHDNNWNGRICLDPAKNVYCVGSHSLLSERLAREKNLEIESKNPNVEIGKLGNYLPPCYWTTNAFSNQSFNIWHKHPFEVLKDKMVIKDNLPSFSAFTWPFRLSFNHDKEKRKKHGYYPPDLEERIQNFINKLVKGESIVFFYLNYDNPISADENKYALVGCAVIKEVEMAKAFPFSEEEKSKWRSYENMQHFPIINWAIKTSYDFQDSGVLLPYKEYLEYVDQHPDASDIINEMRVLVDEESVIPNFKYVASDIDDDICIYLLTKLKKAFEKIKEHGIVDTDITNRQLTTIDRLLEKAWKGRGLYPSLGNVLDFVGDVEGKGREIVDKIKEHLPQDKDLLEETFNLLAGNKSKIPDYLKKHESIIEDAHNV